MAKMTKARKAEQAESVEWLRERLKPGTKVYCINRHTSRSGMMRKIALYIVGEDKELQSIGWHASKALDWPLDRDTHALKVSGCGMDMGFHTVYCLSTTLFGHAERGGYALKHEWM